MNNEPQATEKSEFQTDFKGFKQQASEFFKKLKESAPTQEQIENGLKAIGLALLYMTGTENEKYQAKIVFDIAHRKAAEYQINQIFGALKN